MKKIISIVFLIFTNVFISHTQTTDSSNTDIQNYVAPVAVFHSVNSFAVQVNALLIDSELGLFITSAHLIQWGDLSVIQAFNQWRFLKGNSWLIDPGTHLAIVNLAPPQKNALREIPALAESSPMPPDTVLVQGYIFSGFIDGKPVFDSYSIQTLVKDVEIATDQVYMALEAIDGQLFSNALIGAPLMKDGKIVGVLHDIFQDTHIQAKAIPVSSIKDTLKQVRVYLESLENTGE